MMIDINASYKHILFEHCGKCWSGDIEKETVRNRNFRKVLYTGKSQLAVQTLFPGEDIGVETHHGLDQFFRVEQGTAKFVLNGKPMIAKDGDAVIVPGGVEHNVINPSKTAKLKLYTVYSKPTHKAGTIEKNKPVPDHR